MFAWSVFDLGKSLSADPSHVTACYMESYHVTQAAIKPFEIRESRLYVPGVWSFPWNFLC